MDKWVKAGVIGTYLCLVAAIVTIVVGVWKPSVSAGGHVNFTTWILALSVLLMLLTMLAYKDKWPFSITQKRGPLHRPPFTATTISNAVPPPPVVAQPEQKLRFRITDAIAGESAWVPGRSIGENISAMISKEVDLFIRLRLTNQQEPPMTLLESAWKIELRDGNGQI